MWMQADIPVDDVWPDDEVIKSNRIYSMDKRPVPTSCLHRPSNFAIHYVSCGGWLASSKMS